MRIAGAALSATVSVDNGPPSTTLMGLLPAAPELRIKCGIDEAISNSSAASPLTSSLEEVALVVCPD